MGFTMMDPAQVRPVPSVPTKATKALFERVFGGRNVCVGEM